MNRRHLSVRIAVEFGLIALLAAIVVSLLVYQRIEGMEVATTRQTTLQLAQTVRYSASVAAYLDNQGMADEALRGRLLRGRAALGAPWRNRKL